MALEKAKPSWKAVLLDLKARGLEVSPELAVGDGALGSWKALGKVFPQTRPQRCWRHKTGKVLNCFPRSLQPAVKAKLLDIWMAETREAAERALRLLMDTYEAKYPEATEKLVKDREELPAFYDFPARARAHLRTTNPTESTSSTVRLRTARTKGSGSRMACLTMVFKPAQSAERNWRRLNRYQPLADVIEGVRFQDGIKELAA